MKQEIFRSIPLYNRGDAVILSKLQELSDRMMYLENYTRGLDCMPFQQGVEEMATKINRTVMVNGVKRWIHANSEQEYADKLTKLICGEPQSKAPV